MSNSNAQQASKPFLTRWPVLLGIGAVALCIFGLVLFFLIGSTRVATSEGVSRPLVLIHAPDNGGQVVVGESTMIHAVARDEENVVRVELWIDGALEEIETSGLEGGITPFPFHANWRPETTGAHVLTVRAFNSLGGRAHASIRVEAVASPDRDGDGYEDESDACPDSPGPASEDGCPIPGDADGDGVLDADDACPGVPGLADDDGCPDRDGDGVPDFMDEAPDEPGPAELGGVPDTDGDGVPDDTDLSPEEPGAPESGGAPDTGAGDRDGDGAPDDADPCPGDPGLPEDGFCPSPEDDPPPVGEGSLFENVPGFSGDGYRVLVPLEIEAYEFSVDREYDSVWCYLQLNNEDMERIEFEPQGENYWNIAEELAGDNSVLLGTSTDDPLEVYIDCWADTRYYYREEGEGGIGEAGGSGAVYDLGAFYYEFGSEDWGGGEQIAFGSGPGGESFWSRFRICSPSCDEAAIQAPILDPITWRTGGEPPFMIRWRWDGNEDLIDGFLLSINGTYYYTSEEIGPEARSLDISAYRPSCGEVLEFQIQAYGTDWRSLTSWRTPRSNIRVWDGLPCPRTVLVSFVAFDTGGLGSTRGPIKGTFWANDETLIANYRSGPPSFDATDDTERYLRPGNHYPIPTLFNDIETEALGCFGTCTSNYAPEINYLEVDLGPRDTLTFGATISEPGSYGGVFDAEISILPGEIVPGFYSVSDNGIILNATVDVLVGPEAGTKPDLIIQEIVDSEDYPTPQVRVFNNAADLVDEMVEIDFIRMQTGESVFNVAQTVTIPSGSSALIPVWMDDIYDLRLVLDPDNTIEETDEGEHNNVYETPVRMRVQFVQLGTNGGPCVSFLDEVAEFVFRLKVGHRPPGGSAVWTAERYYPWVGTADYNYRDSDYAAVWDLRDDPYYVFEFDMPAEDSLVVWADAHEDDPGLGADDWAGSLLHAYGPEVNYGHSDSTYEGLSSGFLSCPDVPSLGWGEEDDGVVVWWEITRIH